VAALPAPEVFARHQAQQAEPARQYWLRKHLEAVVRQERALVEDRVAAEAELRASFGAAGAGDAAGAEEAGELLRRSFSLMDAAQASSRQRVGGDGAAWRLAKGGAGLGAGVALDCRGTVEATEERLEGKGYPRHDWTVKLLWDELTQPDAVPANAAPAPAEVSAPTDVQSGDQVSSMLEAAKAQLGEDSPEYNVLAQQHAAGASSLALAALQLDPAASARPSPTPTAEPAAEPAVKVTGLAQNFNLRPLIGIHIQTAAPS
jgi:hypothetical protein